MDTIRDEYAFLPGLDYCCGSGAICWFPESRARIREERFEEAAQTWAERLFTVFHYCNQTFAAEETRYDLSIANYVNLVADAIGIRCDDKFQQYTLCGDFDFYFLVKLQ